MVKPFRSDAANKAGVIKSFSPKELAPRLGTSEQMVRIFLRKYYPEYIEK